MQRRTTRLWYTCLPHCATRQNREAFARREISRQAGPLRNQRNSHTCCSESTLSRPKAQYAECLDPMLGPCCTRLPCCYPSESRGFPARHCACKPATSCHELSLQWALLRRRLPVRRRHGKQSASKQQSIAIHGTYLPPPLPTPWTTTKSSHGYFHLAGKSLSGLESLYIVRRRESTQPLRYSGRLPCLLR